MSATVISHRSWREVVEPALLVATFLAGVALVHPRGDFPLNDDGYYALGAFDFARTGTFHPTQAISSMRAQIVWGAMFVRAFGATYDVLRISSIVAACGAILLVHALLRRAGLDWRARSLATLTFAFSSLFFWSSCTFMSEVPYVFLCALSVWLYVAGIEKESVPIVLCGGLAAALSWWVRQTGIANALAPFVILLIFRDRMTAAWRRLAVAAAMPLALFAALLLFRADWLTGSKAEVSQATNMWFQPTFRFEDQVALVYHYVFYAFFNSALFFAGVTAVLAFLFFRDRSRVKWTVLAAAGGLAAIGPLEMIRAGAPIPFYGARACCDLVYGAVFNNFGLGPPTLPDVWSGRYSYPFHLPPGGSVLVTAIGAALTALLVAAIGVALVPRWRSAPRNVLFFVALTDALLTTAAHCVSNVWFDRYSVDCAWELCVVAALLVPWEIAAARKLSIVCVVMVMLFDVASVGEYFAWNRARWQGWRDLRAAGAAITDIDGGAEPYATFEMARVTDPRTRRRMWFGPGKRRYVLSFHEMPGFRTKSRYPFEGWWGLHRGEVLVLERQGDR